MFLNSEKIDFESLPQPGEKFQLQEIIGEGTYGEVFSALDLEIEENQGKTLKYFLPGFSVDIKILIILIM